MTFRVGDETSRPTPARSCGFREAFANLSDGSAWVFGSTTPAGLEGMFAEQTEYFASLTGSPEKSRIDEIGARWGVTRVGRPLGTHDV
jgi:hypothetical protein